MFMRSSFHAVTMSPLLVNNFFGTLLSQNGLKLYTSFLLLTSRDYNISNSNILVKNSVV